MSNSSGSNLHLFAWSVLGAVLLAVVALFIRAQAQKSNLPHLSQVQPFQLTNQLGQTTALRDLQGKVWVGDIIFTRCGGPCPKMTEEMGKLERAIPADPSLRFVTLTTDPENDTPSALKSYGEKFGADFSRWMFLTGPKAEI